MKANLDFSDTEDGFSLMPEGEYDVKLFDVDRKDTRNGDDMFVLILKVQNEGHKGRQLYYNLPVMKQTMWKIRDTLQAFGQEVPQKVVEVDFDELLGKSAVAVVEHEQYKGEARESVENIVAPSVEGSSASTEEEPPF